MVGAKGSRAPEGVSLIETVEAGARASEEEAYKIYKDKLEGFDVVVDMSWQKWSYVHKMKENENLKIIGVVHAPCPYRRPPNVRFPCFVGVSKAHAEYMGARLGIPCRWIHNGIDVDLYPFKAEKGKRYLSLNRCMKEKGIIQFVDLMRRTRSFADVAGEDVKLITDSQYVDRVRERCDGYLLRYYGAVSHERKVELLQNAKALVLLPLKSVYLEVWSLSCTESLACGTPVVALSNGGLKEQVQDGVNGFLCETLEEVEEIIKAGKVSEIKPEECRASVEKFSKQEMAKTYLDLITHVKDGEMW